MHHFFSIFPVSRSMFGSQVGRTICLCTTSARDGSELIKSFHSSRNRGMDMPVGYLNWSLIAVPIQASLSVNTCLLYSRLACHQTGLGIPLDADLLVS